MKYIGIGMMWLGIAGAIVGVAFALHDNEAVVALGIFLGIMGAVVTPHIAHS